MDQMERPWDLGQQVGAEATAQPLTFEDLFSDHHEALRRLYMIAGNSALVLLGLLDLRSEDAAKLLPPPTSATRSSAFEECCLG
jgi:hypothetical protein